MNKTVSFKQQNWQLWLGTAMAACLIGSMSSCNMMEDDRTYCPYGLYVKFKYDYNTQQADIFKDHVGSVSLYVYDEAGKLVTTRTVSNDGSTQPLAQPGYQMHLDDLPAGKYHLLAIAQQKPAETLMQAKGAKFRYTVPAKGDDMKQLNIKLDRAETPDAEGRYAVSNDAPLDTLWHGIYTNDESVFSSNIDKNGNSTLSEDEKVYGGTVTVEDQVPTYVTLSLMRDTKNLSVVLRQTHKPANITANDYRVEITDNNGWLNYDNSLHQDNTLLYTPYAEWTTTYSDNGETGIEKASKTDDEAVVVQRAAHYDLSFSRLMNYADQSKNARMRIYNTKNNKLVADINLPAMLAEGRNAFETYNYTPQQFLDREYNYKLEFFLVGDEWQYVNLSISILNWSVRIQNTNL